MQSVEYPGELAGNFASKDVQGGTNNSLLSVKVNEHLVFVDYDEFKVIRMRSQVESKWLAGEFTEVALDVSEFVGIVGLNDSRVVTKRRVVLVTDHSSVNSCSIIGLLARNRTR